MTAKLLPGDPPIELTLRRSVRAKRITLRVSALDGRVTLTLPKGIAERTALEFAQDKEPWIRKHLSRQNAPVTVGLGVELPVEGKMLTVTPGLVRAAQLSGDQILVPNAPEMAGHRVRAYLKLKAKERLTERSHHYATRVGREIGRITLRDTRSRWGSCSAAGNLMYSWRLIMAPPEVLDYVAAHEVAHRVEMNHSNKYWAIVDRIFPDYTAQRAWLRNHGSTLHRYQFDD